MGENLLKGIYESASERPLAGVTVLVVEDSRFASDAVRLLCLRSGARIRRADTLRAAHRHLGCYRPDVILVDVGLPDGSGIDLIATLARAQPKIPAILGLSGDPGAEAAARAAGADGFLAKPLRSLGLFQHAILSALPAAGSRSTPRPLDQATVTPDTAALCDDLGAASQMLADAPSPEQLAYLAQFVGGLARQIDDAALQGIARRLAQAPLAPEGHGAEIAALGGQLRRSLLGYRHAI